MAATRCVVAVFKRVYCKPVQASSVDRVASLVDECFSHERLIFQSVSKNISLQLEEEPKRKVWSSLLADGGANGNHIAPKYKEKQLPFPKADIHKILLLLMRGICGVLVPIRTTAIVYAARCEVCIEIGPSPSLPSSVPHEIVLNVATSAWLHYVPETLLALVSFHCLLRAAETKHLRWCDVQTFDVSLPTRYEKKFLASPTSAKMAGHASQQHVLLECPAICQLVNTMKSSVPDHRLATAIWKFTATQYFAYCQRQLWSLGVSHQHYTLHGLGGGGATDHWLHYRDVPQQ